MRQGGDCGGPGVVRHHGGPAGRHGGRGLGVLPRRMLSSHQPMQLDEIASNLGWGWTKFEPFSLNFREKQN